MSGNINETLDRYRRTDGKFGPQPAKLEPAAGLTLTTVEPTTGGWVASAEKALADAHERIASLEEKHWKAREEYDQAPSSSSDPALKAVGGGTWDDAVSRAKNKHRSASATAAELAEQHYRTAGCKWSRHYVQDMIDHAVTHRAPVKPIVKRTGPAAAQTKAAVQSLQADPEWEKLRAATEDTATEFGSVVSERDRSRSDNLFNDRTKTDLLKQLNLRKRELSNAYTSVRTAEQALPLARVLDESGVPDTAVQVRLRDRDVLRINPDGSTNLWVRKAAAGDESAELFQRAVAARPLGGPGGGIELKLADGSTVSSVAMEERRAGTGQPVVRPGRDLTLYAEPATADSVPSSQAFGPRFAFVGGYDDLY